MVDLKRLAFDKNLNQSALGETLGLPQSEVSKLMNGRRDIKQEHIDLLTAHFGEECVKKYMVSDEIISIFQSPQVKQIDASIVPAEIVEEIKAEVVAEASIPIISPDVANQPNYDVRKYLEDNASELETINPNELVKGATAAERVLRGAMQPTFIPGDVVFVRFLQNKTKITDGNIYYFDMESRPTMIRKVKIEGDKLRLIAENPDFGDVVTTFADILNVAEIVGMFRTTFTTQYSEIEAVRRKKDEQVDNLIKQNGEALNIIKDLIKKG